MNSNLRDVEDDEETRRWRVQAVWGCQRARGLITDDVVNQTKSYLIDLGRYHDSFLALKEVLATHPVAGLLDEDLQKIVRVMHDRGTERLYRGETRQNIEKGKKFVVDYLVENHKVTRGDAQQVAKGWYDQVFTYHWR